MTPADTRILKDAVARGAAAVLSLPSDGMLRHHRTRFLVPADHDGFWIEAPPAAANERPLINQLITTRAPVGVSLKTGINKIVFASLVRQFEAALPVNDQTVVDALLLAWPDQVQAVQRRSDYRAALDPADADDLRVRCWRIAEHHHLRDKPLASAALRVVPRDLSAGGMGLLYTPDPDGPKLADEQRLRITLAHRESSGHELILEGRVRHTRPLPGGNYRLGVQFKKLEDDLEGRQALAALTQIVGLLQRTEIRRKRIAASRAASAAAPAATLAI